MLAVPEDDIHGVMTMRDLRQQPSPLVPRRPSTARTRAYRERQRNRERLLSIRISEEVVEALVRFGYLNAEERDDGAALRAAVEGHLGDLLIP
jgi:hypothetical protein